jgi:hypothetical protein
MRPWTVVFGEKKAWPEGWDEVETGVTRKVIFKKEILVTHRVAGCEK